VLCTLGQQLEPSAAVSDHLMANLMWRHVRRSDVRMCDQCGSPPLQVTQNGLVSTLPGFRHFPDTKADVIGKKIQVSCAWHRTLLVLALQRLPLDTQGPL
jgi:Phospholipase D C terminal